MITTLHLHPSFHTGARDCMGESETVNPQLDPCRALGAAILLETCCDLVRHSWGKGDQNKAALLKHTHTLTQSCVNSQCCIALLQSRYTRTHSHTHWMCDSSCANESELKCRFKRNGIDSQ